MGLLVLHSAHYSKIFKTLLGTPCDLRWRNDGERELVWTVDPSHPIAARRAEPDRDRRAGDVRRARSTSRAPDELIFISSFAGGEVFRGGCTLARGAGGSSTSARATRSTPSTTIPTSSGCWPTRSQWAAPRLRQAPAGSPESPVGWWQ